MKNALVTGYLNGMGKGTYEALRKAGHNVIGWDILDETDAVDVSSVESVRAGIARFPEGLKLDAVALCAGIWSEAPFLQTTVEQWNDLMGTNAFGIFNCVQQLVPHMNPGGAFAVAGFVEAVARELAAPPRRLRINAVCPFYVRTPMTDRALIEKEQLTGITVEESYQLEGAEVPLGYVAEKEDIADFMVSLLSPAGRYVTGAVIPITGGAHCGYGAVLSSYNEKESYEE